MKKAILWFSTGLITTAFLILPVGVWAVSDKDDTRNPWAARPSEKSSPDRSLGMPRRGNTPDSSDAPATPPGVLHRPTSLKQHAYMGKISAILTANHAFTLATRQGPKTIQTDDQTKFLKGHTRQSARTTFENLKVNDEVAALGETNDAGTVAAKLVVVLPVNPKEIRRHAVSGTVDQKTTVDSSASTTLLVLRHPNNSKTFRVLVDGETKITSRSNFRLTVNDIKIGQRVIAVGKVDEVGQITAKIVHITPSLAVGSPSKPSVTSVPRQTVPGRSAMPPGRPHPLPSPAM